MTLSVINYVHLYIYIYNPTYIILIISHFLTFYLFAPFLLGQVTEQAAEVQKVVARIEEQVSKLDKVHTEREKVRIELSIIVSLKHLFK